MSKYGTECNKYATFLLHIQFRKLKIGFIGTTCRQCQHHLTSVQFWEYDPPGRTPELLLELSYTVSQVPGDTCRQHCLKPSSLAVLWRRGENTDLFFGLDSKLLTLVVCTHVCIHTGRQRRCKRFWYWHHSLIIKLLTSNYWHQKFLGRLLNIFEHIHMCHIVLCESAHIYLSFIFHKFSQTI